MPVYRGGKGAMKLPKEKRRLLRKEVSRVGGRRVYSRRQNWAVKNTPLKEIKNFFPYIFSPVRKRASFIEGRFREKGKPVVVLDWGCGKGRAAGELKKELGETVQVYGFSKDSYPEWRGAQGVKFIHATKDDLLRYLKDGSVDLIYSMLGLEYLAHEKELIPHIAQLLPKLSKGGKIVFSKPGESHRILSELTELLGEKASITLSDKSFYITKK